MGDEESWRPMTGSKVTSGSRYFHANSDSVDVGIGNPWDGLRGTRNNQVLVHRLKPSILL